MPSSKPPVVRRDATGHLNPEYERKLRETSLENQNTDAEDTAFLGGKSTSSDPLAEELGESFVQSATSGEDAETEGCGPRTDHGSRRRGHIGDVAA